MENNNEMKKTNHVKLWEQFSREEGMEKNVSTLPYEEIGREGLRIIGIQSDGMLCALVDESDIQKIQEVFDRFNKRYRSVGANLEISFNEPAEGKAYVFGDIDGGFHAFGPEAEPLTSKIEYWITSETDSLRDKGPINSSPDVLQSPDPQEGYIMACTLREGFILSSLASGHGTIEKGRTIDQYLSEFRSIDR